jgi:hypothetical protein
MKNIREILGDIQQVLIDYQKTQQNQKRPGEQV